VSVYTRRFAAIDFAASGSNPILFTADSAATYVVRDIIFTPRSGTGAEFLVYVFTGSANLELVSQQSPVLGQSYHYEMRQVLATGDELVAYSPFTDNTVLVTGYALQ
jgi:hypothetical protein